MKLSVAILTLNEERSLPDCLRSLAGLECDVFVVDSGSTDATVEIARAAGDLPAAILAFERAVTVEDTMDYDEPEPLPFAARHWLGAALVDAGRHADAERVYREELEDHPHNGWSLTGLRLALKAQGKNTADVDRDLTSSWARSDTWIRTSVARGK